MALHMGLHLANPVRRWQRFRFPPQIVFGKNGFSEVVGQYFDNPPEYLRKFSVKLEHIFFCSGSTDLTSSA